MRFAISRRKSWIGLGAVFLIALAVRLTAESSLRETSPRRFVSVDCLYHMRRARFSAAHFPKVLFFDPAIDFPRGAVSIWPPLFDLALALPARVLDGPGASRERIESLASLVPPFLGALAAVAAGLLAGRVRRGYAIPAALFVALCGAHVQYSQYGHTDQHVAESLTCLLAMTLFLRSRERPGLGREAAAGAGLALAVLTWQGAVCGGAAIAAALAIDALRKDRSGTARAAAVVLGGAAALSGGGVAFWLAGDSLPFTFVSFGWFQPAFLLALAVGVIALDVAAGALRRLPAPRPALVAKLGAVLAGSAVLAPRAGELVRGFLGGIGHVTVRSSARAVPGGYLATPREFLRQVFEARPLLADGLRLPIDALSAAFLLIPVPLIVWSARAARGPRRRAHLALAAWGTVTLFLALAQRLNVYYAAPLAALAALETGRQALVRLRFRLRRRKLGRIAPSLAAGALGILIVATLVPGLRRQLDTRYEAGDDLVRTLEAARSRLPHPVDLYDPRFLPPRRPVPELDAAGSFLSPWSLGHFVTYYAEMPVAADNFGYGFFDSIRFFLATDEDSALAVARSRRARYVLATDLTAKMNDYGSILGMPPLVLATPAGTSVTPEYFRTVQSRLYDFDGAGAALPNGWTVRPLEHFRLLLASRTGERRYGRFLARWKIFEIR